MGWPSPNTCPGSMQPIRWSTEHQQTKEPFQQRRLSVAPKESVTTFRSVVATLPAQGRYPGTSPGTTVTKLGVSGDGVQQFVDLNVYIDHLGLATVDFKNS